MTLSTLHHWPYEPDIIALLEYLYLWSRSSLKNVNTFGQPMGNNSIYWLIMWGKGPGQSSKLLTFVDLFLVCRNTTLTLSAVQSQGRPEAKQNETKAQETKHINKTIGQMHFTQVIFTEGLGAILGER